MRRGTSDLRGLTAERLEQRTSLAADSYGAHPPYECPTEQWSMQADVVTMPCTGAPVDASAPTMSCDLPPITLPDCPPEAVSAMTPCDAPAVGSDCADATGPAAIAESADMWQMMAARAIRTDGVHCNAHSCD